MEETKRVKQESLDAPLLFSKMDQAFQDSLRTLKASNYLPGALLLEKQPRYAGEVSFGPSSARNFKLFQTDPNKRVKDPEYVLGFMLLTSLSHYAPTDFSLNATEMQFFQRNGFVVQPRLGNSSMGNHYYNLYSNDMPVFVTSDAILHAWHWSFDRLFGEIEEEYALPELASTLRGLQKELANLGTRNAIFTETLASKVDTYLTVAITLSVSEPQFKSTYRDGKYIQEPNKKYIPGSTSLASTDKSVVANLVQAANDARGIDGALFWKTIDWNDFKPAGRYEKSLGLKAYYKTVKWVSLPIQFATSKDVQKNSDFLENFKILLFLIHLLRTFGSQKLAKLASVLESLAGPSDGITLLRLDDILKSAGYDGALVTLIDSEEKLMEVFKAVLSSPVSPELINSDLLPQETSDDSSRYVSSVLAGSLCIDQWAFSKITSEVPKRRAISIVDVAYSVLDNADAGTVISDRITLPVDLSPKDQEPPFTGYANHPSLVPEDQRGLVVAEFPFSTGYFQNAEIHRVQIRENDTVATLKHQLWPFADRVKRNELPLTPVNVSVSSKNGDAFYFLGDNQDSTKVVDCLPMETILASDIEEKWRFGFSNIFPSKRPDTAPEILEPHVYRALRDGIPYHLEIEAVRRAVNEMPKEAWSNSVYNNWLNTLRMLSPSAMEEGEWYKLPQVQRSRR